MKSIPALARLLPAVCLMMAAILSSCSKTPSGGDRRAELINELSDNAMITVAFSPASILKSAGMEVTNDGVTASNSLQRLVAANSSLKKAVDFIVEAKGIDYSAAVIAGGTTDGAAIFAISDRKKFTEWIGSQGYDVTSDGDYTVCFKDGGEPAVVIDGQKAWFIGSAVDAAKPVAIVNDNKAAASKKPIASWKAERLAKDDINALVNVKTYMREMNAAFANAGLAVKLDGIYNDECNYTSADIDFDGPTAKMSGEAFDGDGKPTAIFAQGTYTTIPSSALALLKNQQIALGCSFPDAWKNLFMGAMNGQIDLQYAVLINQVLSSFKAVTFGVTVSEGVAITNVKPSDIEATVAIDFDKATAEKTVEMLKPLAASFGASAYLSEVWQALSGKSTYTFTPEPSMPDLKVYLTGRDGLALITTDASLADTKLPTDSKLDGLIGYLSVNLKKSHPAMVISGCDFGIEAQFISTNEVSEGHVTLTDTDKPILESLITLLTKLL